MLAAGVSSFALAFREVSRKGGPLRGRRTLSFPQVFGLAS
jgi:hypothetical protein